LAIVETVPNVLYFQGLAIKDKLWYKGQAIKDMENKGLEVKKTEKLATALYMLTSFFSDQEPMKWHLRSLSTKLLTQKENQPVVEEIISLLAVAKNAGLVSQMNYEIVNREFAKLLPEPLLLQNLLVSKNLEPTVPVVTLPEKLYVSSSVAVSPIKDRMSEIKAPEPKTLKEFGAIAVKKNSRQSIIISLLKRKKEIMIKDVSPLIAGVSEKTIQRELLSMVHSGVLKKEGEKRWSRYSLAE
jgi:hypothetical protein